MYEPRSADVGAAEVGGMLGFVGGRGVVGCIYKVLAVGMRNLGVEMSRSWGSRIASHDVDNNA